MRIAVILATVALSVDSPATSQGLPVRIQPPVVADTGAAGQGEEVLGAYLRRRFEALGITIAKSDSVTSVEVNFSVLPTGAEYDVAAVLTIEHCSSPGRPVECTRGTPFDWMQLHGYGDLEQAARRIAENVYRELGPIADLLRRVDSTRSH